MKWLDPLPEENLSDDSKKALSRAREKFKIDDDQQVPTWLHEMANSPQFLKDTYMNVSRHIMEDGALSAMLKLTIATAVASHAGHRDLATFFAQLAKEHGATRDKLYEAAGIAATSTTFNHYYKFRSLYEGDEFNGFNPGLRATLFSRPSQGKAFAEIVNLVISSINGCKSCVNGHVQDALKEDVTRDQLDEALRTGAIVMGMCAFAS